MNAECVCNTSGEVIQVLPRYYNINVPFFQYLYRNVLQFFDDLQYSTSQIQFANAIPRKSPPFPDILQKKAFLKMPQCSQKNTCLVFLSNKVAIIFLRTAFSIGHLRWQCMRDNICKFLRVSDLKVFRILTPHQPRKI